MKNDKMTKAVKKTTPKKVESDKEIKEEVKTVKKVIKEVKKEDKKPAVKKTVKKEEKTEAKKEVKKTVKKEEKAEAKKEVKKTAKKAVKKEEKAVDKNALSKEEKADLKSFYENITADDCLNIMYNTLKVTYTRDDYVKLLLEEKDKDKLAESIIKEYNVEALNLNYRDYGYDLNIVRIALDKLESIIPVKVNDLESMKKDMEEIVYKEEYNWEGYHSAFRMLEKLLVIGQRMDIHDSKEIEEKTGAEIVPFMSYFFNAAAYILPQCNFTDVEFLEDFGCEFLAQFDDLYEIFEEEFQICIAQLYIKHDHTKRGDEDFEYLLRENKIKDYIFFRYVEAYVGKDLDKAKAIGYRALNYIDDRYVYYQNIKNVLEH